MCGIIGYTGYSEARGILLKGLKTLEYRGYDSAGVAVYHPDFNETLVTKCEGRVEKLESKCSSVKGTTGIGHTRWATHGGVSDINSHPHKFGRVTLVHNGIVENYAAIKNQLGVAHKLMSQTDSEVVAALIDAYYEGDPTAAIVSAVKELSGTFGLAIMFDDIPNKIFAVRNVSPIVCCKNEDGCYIASDIMAIGEYSEDYFVLPEFSVAEITPEGFVIKDFEGNAIEPDMLKLDWDIKNSGKKGYPFYMEKEIMEQPEVITKTIESRIVDGMPDFTADNVDDSIFTDCDNVTVIACGTAMHAGLIGKHIIEKYCKVPVTVNMASEYMYNDPIINDKTLVICVSQSGETIDTLEALKYARRRGARSLSIVNVKGSTIARESENVIYTNAGPEIAVASTKAYTTQVAVFYLIAAKMAHIRGLLNDYSTKHFIDELCKIPAAVSSILDRRQEIHKLSNSMLTGELKHGTIALITNQTPVIALLSQDTLMSKQVSNIREVQSRGAEVITFIKSNLKTKDVECSFELPSLEDDFMAIPSIIAMQLLAYYVSSDKGLDVDKPRNIAKVVTVE
jgi:glucosamine--fructose-6-phosphate aminotransferase (isomerizing)